MRIGKIIGTVIATHKDPKLEGIKLLIVRPIDLNGKEEDGYILAADTVQAGMTDTVIVVQGSSARMATGMNDKPVDATIIGIVDQYKLDEKAAK
jgi:microcompartment protein CcmK/EutM